MPGRGALRAPRPALAGGPGDFTPCPDMQAGRASAINRRFRVFTGELPFSEAGLMPPFRVHIQAVLSVCQFQQCLSATIRLPPTERASELLSVTSAPWRANLEPS